MLDKPKLKPLPPAPRVALALITYSDSGGEVVQEYPVEFDATISKVVTIMTKSQTKYDQFLAEYPSRLLQPI